MEQIQIPFDSIRPYVRFAQDVYVSPSHRTMPVTTYDHRLFYIVSGHARITVNGSEKELGPCSLMYWMSGTTYHIRAKGDTPLHILSVNFDFTQDHAAESQYLPMVSPQDYDPHKRMENISFTDAAVMNAPVILPEASDLLPHLHAMLRESDAPQLHTGFQLSNLMSIILTTLCRAASQRQSTTLNRSSFKTILDYIQKHYAEELDNQKLASVFNYHPYYISQIICTHTGIPLHQYLLKVRIRQAILLLQTTDLPVNEIAFQVGFKNASYFSRYFKQCTGYSPKALRIK